MSDSSGNNSGSPQKGFFKRMLGQEETKVAKQTDIKQRHPGFTVSNEAAVTPGRTARPQEVIISPGVRQLNKDGYVVYNTPEKQDVYVTIQPETAFFEDEEPPMVRMAGGSFVGGNGRAVQSAVPMRSEPGPEPIMFTQPADIFTNAHRRAEYEEIDFGETIIIKKNDKFDEEIKEYEEKTVRSPVFYRPAHEEVRDPVMEESFALDIIRQEAAETSSDEEADVPELPSAEYAEIAEKEEEEEYEVTDITVETSPVTEAPAPVTEAPIGMYMEGHRPMDAAEADAEAEEEPSFIEKTMEAEMAATSASAKVEAPAILPMSNLLCLPAPAEPAETVTFAALPEEVSETVADMPVSTEITDPVADIMKLTVPELRMSDDLIAELSKGWERTIPEDGLEAYDCIFSPMRVPAREEVPQTVSFGFEGRESALNPQPSVNFRFG